MDDLSSNHDLYRRYNDSKDEAFRMNTAPPAIRVLPQWDGKARIEIDHHGDQRDASAGEGFVTPRPLAHKLEELILAICFGLEQALPPEVIEDRLREIAGGLPDDHGIEEYGHGADEVIAAIRNIYYSEEAGRLVWSAWYSGMIHTGRHVAIERQSWRTLPAADKALDTSIATILLQQLADKLDCTFRRGAYEDNESYPGEDGEIASYEWATPETIDSMNKAADSLDYAGLPVILPGPLAMFASGMIERLHEKREQFPDGWASLSLGDAAYLIDMSLSNLRRRLAKGGGWEEIQLQAIDIANRAFIFADLIARDPSPDVVPTIVSRFPEPEWAGRVTDPDSGIRPIRYPEPERASDSGSWGADPTERELTILRAKAEQVEATETRAKAAEGESLAWAATVDARDRTIEELSLQIREQAREAARDKEIIAARDREAAKLHEEIEARDERITELTAKTNRQEREAESTHSQLMTEMGARKTAETRIADLEAFNRHRIAENDKQGRALDAITGRSTGEADRAFLFAILAADRPDVAETRLRQANRINAEGNAITQAVNRFNVGADWASLDPLPRLVTIGANALALWNDFRKGVATEPIPSNSIPFGEVPSSNWQSLTDAQAEQAAEDSIAAGLDRDGAED